jgi:cytochrome c oxidase subunit 1
VPILYCLAAILLIGVGGYTGLTLSLSPIRRQLMTSYYLVAHFHAILFGGTILGALAFLHHAWPEFTGRRYDERLSKAGFLTVVAGIFLTFLPQFSLGHEGMPRHLYAYPPQMLFLNRLSTLGACVLALGVVTHLAALFRNASAPSRPGA